MFIKLIHNKELQLNSSVFPFFAILSTLCTSVSQGAVVGNNNQNFSPAETNQNYVAVSSAAVLPRFNSSYSLFANYAVNTAPVFVSNGATPSRNFVHDAIWTLDLNASLGLGSGIEIGAQAPYLIYQRTEKGDAQGQYATPGNTEVRGHIKWRFFERETFGFALIGSYSIDRLRNNPYTGSHNEPTYDFIFATDAMIGETTIGGNIGYQWRFSEKDPNQSVIEPVGNQITWGAAIAIPLSNSTHIIPELFGAVPTQRSQDQTDRHQGSAEGLVNVKKQLTPALTAVGGLGSELFHGQSTPDWRIVAGLSFTPDFSKPAHALPKVTATETAPIPVPLPPPNQEDPFGEAKSYEEHIVRDILFEFDSAKINFYGQNSSLLKLPQHLRKLNGFKKLIIIGHTDSIGPDPYNKSLSTKRAEAIKQWLVITHGFPQGTIYTSGRGEEEPVASNKTVEGRQLNRRVQFKIFR